jgi:geranyl-CoA carboxylase beta subunit
VPGGGLVIGIGYVSGVRCMVAGQRQRDQGRRHPADGPEEEPARRQPSRARTSCRFCISSNPPAPTCSTSVEDLHRRRRLLRQPGAPLRRGHSGGDVVHGASTAGGAYMPGLSDYVILVRGRAKAFLAGPPLLKAATGEDSDEETLGGAEMHATVTACRIPRRGRRPRHPPRRAR